MKLLACLIVVFCLGTAAAAQSADEQESAEKKPPSRVDVVPAVPQILDEGSEMEMPRIVCAKIRAFVFRMTEDERLEYVGTTTCPRPLGGGLKKIDRQPRRPAPALYAY